MTNTSDDYKYRPYQVPEELYIEFEKMAIKERRTTGKNITWSQLVKKALEEFLKKKNN